MCKSLSCRKCRWGLGLVAFIALLVLVSLFAPWKPWLQNKIKATLEAQGFPDVQLTVEGLSLSGITLKDVSFGGGAPLSMKNMTLGYSFADILSGHFNDVTVKGLSLEANQNKDRWTLAGRESGSQESEPLKIPLTLDELSVLPMNNGKLEDSQLVVNAIAWKMALPLHMTWQKEPIPEITYKATGLRLKVPEYELVSGEAALNAGLNETNGQWEGQWEIKDIKIMDGETTAPPLNGHGTLTALADKILINGEFESADKSYRSSFATDVILNEPKKSLLTLADVAMPWNGGTIAARDVKMSFTGSKALKINLQVQHVAVNDLLQQLTGKQASGTGVISGVLPVVVNPDGSILVTGGALQAEGPGEIVLPPDFVPGDNENVALVRDVLKNLHYSVLSVTVDNGKDNKLSILMTVEGNNPDVYGGKAVKLNVHLTGDVLSFVQQNLIALTNPEKLLEQGK